MPDSQTANIAFIGGGSHATQGLLPNVAHIPEFRLAAVCDLDADRAADVARRFGAPRSFADVERMLDEARPDGCCICGPGEMHHAVGLQVLRRGIPVFMEKPPGHTLEDARELVQAAADAGTWGMVGFMKRFAPANQVAKEYLASPEFGRLTSMSLVHGCGPYTDPRRMLLYNGIHMIDMARFFGGEVAGVHAYDFGQETTQALAIGMRFASGAVGVLNMNSSQSWSDCFEQAYLAGIGSVVLVDSSRAVEMMAQGARFAEARGLETYGWGRHYYVSGNMAQWSASGHYTRGYWGELSRFARALTGAETPYPTLHEGVAAMRIIDAVMASAASGDEVEVQ